MTKKDFEDREKKLWEQIDALEEKIKNANKRIEDIDDKLGNFKLTKEESETLIELAKLKWIIENGYAQKFNIDHFKKDIENTIKSNLEVSRIHIKKSITHHQYNLKILEDRLNSRLVEVKIKRKYNTVCTDSSQSLLDKEAAIAFDLIIYRLDNNDVEKEEATILYFKHLDKGKNSSSAWYINKEVRSKATLLPIEYDVEYKDIIKNYLKSELK